MKKIFHKMLFLPLLHITIVVAVLVQCASIASKSTVTVKRPKGFGSAKRAIIIGVDGLGGIHLRNVTNKYSSFKSFFNFGSFTTRARGVYPTSSGPNWSSFVTGLDVFGHGVLSNDWMEENGDPLDDVSYSIPPVTGRGRPLTIFTQVKKKDSRLKTAMMFTWSWLRNYVINNSDIDAWHWGGEGITCAPNDVVDCYDRKDWHTMLAVTKNLAKDPVLTLIHLDAVDLAGHGSCWGCPLYYKAMRTVDNKIIFLLNALKRMKDSSGKIMLDDTLIVIVSDHGGWRNSHSYSKPIIANVDIPILFRGPGVLKNNSLENIYVSNVDVAATVLNAIAVEKSEFMPGKVLEQIYQ